MREDSVLKREADRTQVVIFAGGLGRRMGIEFPKALLQAGGRTMLDRCIDLHADAGFRRFVLILGHKSEEIVQHMGKHAREDIAWSFAVSPDVTMGRAVSFKHAIESGAIDPTRRSILVYPDDIFTDEELPAKVLLAHVSARRSAGTLGTIVLTKGLRWPYGVAEVGQDGIVSGFVEKPPTDYPTSVGMYVVEPEVNDLLTSAEYTRPVELEQTIIPQLSASRQLYGFFIPNETWLPVNTPKELDHAQKILTQIHLEKRKPLEAPYQSAVTR
jgi:NDP-sugar pyrophosphorylase family protein